MTRRMYASQRQNALDAQPQEFRLFAKLAEANYTTAATGLFADVLLQLEIGGTTEYRAEMVRVAASIWHATVFHASGSLISQQAAQGVSPHLWLVVGRLCKFGHPYPANVSPDELKRSGYVARREHWQKGFGLILNIEPGRVSLADLMQGA